MPALKNSILDTIGNTPVVRINNLARMALIFTPSSKPSTRWAR